MEQVHGQGWGFLEDLVYVQYNIVLWKRSFGGGLTQDAGGLLRFL